MHYFDYILDHYTWAGVALLILLFITFIIQILYYAATYRRIVKYRISKRRKRLSEAPAISVVIPLLSEDYEFLGGRLPRILTQKYEAEYEVIVMFMGDNGDFYEELESMRLAYPTLRVAKIKYNPLLRITPKQVINLGIKSALHEHIVITTTTAAPSTESWLSMMGKGFMRGEIVAGYTAIEQRSGIINGLIRMSRMQTAIYHLSGAVKGETYNVSRSNFGMTKSVYFAANGFSHHNMNIGENDLFIQKIATRKNMCVVLTPKATVVARQWGGLGWWLSQLKYFGSTYEQYPLNARNRIEWDLRSQALFFMLAIAAMVVMPLEIKLLAAVLMLIRIGVVLSTVRAIAKRLDEKKITLRYILFDALNPLMMALLRIKFLRKDHSAWK